MCYGDRSTRTHDTFSFDCNFHFGFFGLLLFFIFFHFIIVFNNCRCSVSLPIFIYILFYLKSISFDHQNYNIMNLAFSIYYIIVNVGVRAFAQNALRNFSYYFVFFSKANQPNGVCVRVNKYFCAFITNNWSISHFRNAMVVKM